MKIRDIPPGGYAWTSTQPFMLFAAGDGSYECVDPDGDCTDTYDETNHIWIARSTMKGQYGHEAFGYVPHAESYGFEGFANGREHFYAQDLIWKNDAWRERMIRYALARNPGFPALLRLYCETADRLNIERWRDVCAMVRREILNQPEVTT